ncbi:MAG: DUF1273 family protein [Oscillospiraceae bacterium]|nr:DUF1273 family protein [Oscillospiraceae bacterium]
MVCSIISDGKEIDDEYIDEYKYDYSVIRTLLRFQIDSLLDDGFDEFYINCSCGTPIWAGHYLALLTAMNSAKLHLILPCENMTDGWSRDTKDKFSVILKSADSIKYVSKEYTPDCYAISENMLIDAADLIVLCGTPQNLIKQADKALKKKKNFFFLRY